MHMYCTSYIHMHLHDVIIDEINLFDICVDMAWVLNNVLSCVLKWSVCVIIRVCVGIQQRHFHSSIGIDFKVHSHGSAEPKLYYPLSPAGHTHTHTHTLSCMRTDYRNTRSISLIWRAHRDAWPGVRSQVSDQSSAYVLPHDIYTLWLMHRSATHTHTPQKRNTH